ncbi:hypothetical protein [Chitinimonas koreensis]|uniref:hypothetical protein n=1 Tax=Chitinimonas koreensis TaxID=356302 RepID=UPI000684BE16|nr:hypothetical protein [Chitinimonas koreensis]QNM96771.1 hypothetical protein H9L41_24045 [Chitinimonas koreensis]
MKLNSPAVPLKPSSLALALGGVILIGLGLYFIFIRPALLPEDPRFMGTTLEQIRSNFPGLLLWLPRVFWVMGGYMVSSGLLTFHLARTSFCSRTAGAAWVAALSGLSSIGLMVVVNFLIDSDFKWLLLAFTAPWLAALWLYSREG